jgi:hypothetical protein
MSQFVFWDTERIRLSYFPQQAGRGHRIRRLIVMSRRTVSKNKRVVTVIDIDTDGGTGIGLVVMIEVWPL